MKERPIRVLLLGQSGEDTDWLRELTLEIEEGRFVRSWMHHFELISLERLSDAVTSLSHGDRFEVALINPQLPDAQGLYALRKLEQLAPEMPVVVLADRDDEDLAVSLICSGAQDFLVKSELDCLPLARALSLAIERKHRETALASVVHRDSLTGLYNRTGFRAAAIRDRALAQRLSSPTSLLLVEIDGLDEVGRKYGRHEVDLAILEAAEVLTSTFRECDLVGRIDERLFGILMLDEHPAIPKLTALRFDILIRKKAHRRLLRIHTGVTTEHYHLRQSPPPFDDMLRVAEDSLCENKRCCLHPNLDRIAV